MTSVVSERTKPGAKIPPWPDVPVERGFVRQALRLVGLSVVLFVMVTPGQTQPVQREGDPVAGRDRIKGAGKLGKEATEAAARQSGAEAEEPGAYSPSPISNASSNPASTNGASPPVASSSGSTSEEGENSSNAGARSPRSAGPNGIGRDALSEPNRIPEFIEQDTSVYRIGIGDVLQINVWKEPEVSVPSVSVRLDGRISLPLVKELQVQGLTPTELEWLLTEAFSRFITAPNVTVIVQQVNSQKAYLVGGVNNPGAIQLRVPMTILQALAEAGGLTNFAKKNKIYVLRKEGDRQLRLPFQYDAVIRGRNAEQNVVIRPGDTIVVPQ